MGKAEEKNAAKSKAAQYFYKRQHIYFVSRKNVQST